MATNPFEIPGVYYFESKNIFSGSKGNFNYRIVPGEGLNVQVWHGFICSEKAEIGAENSFPLNDEGHAQMLTWLEEEFRKGK